ncbi:hypothetical protein ONS96_001584 [Cadophora gregata f. sp. sojae]|nr:hypothetical protein ONS96_001584 [Cadophora gregata f. sp. sojae]
MTFSPPLPPKLFTRDLAAYTDAELNEHLDANEGEVDVEDPEEPMKDESFAQRLR